MAKHSKDKMRENQSKESKEDNSTLTDYALKKMLEKGLLVKKGKLPKNWSRTIFKR
jgi:hypothetical protein